MARRDRLFLDDIVQTADEIAELIDGFDQARFLTDLRTKRAIASCLVIIGEAVACLPEDLRERYPEVAWKEARGLRNVLAHQYWGTDWAIIWEAAARDVPVLRSQIVALLSQEFPGG